jgi:predicted nucleotidyltransferase
MTNVIEQHREEVAALCRRTGARRLDVFGSAARADFDPASSDLDFYVEFDELPPARYGDAYFALKESLELLFGRPVDLITEAGLATSSARPWTGDSTTPRSTCWSGACRVNALPCAVRWQRR